MVVEFLTFRVDASRRDAWIEREGEVWSTFLERQPGFVRKELWESADDPTALHAVIWWDDHSSWKAISADTVAAVDAEMGDLVIDPVESVFTVVRTR